VISLTDTKADSISILLILILLVPMMIYEGFAFSLLWSWFVVPVFKLPELTILQAIGVMLLVTMCKNTSKTRDEDPFKAVVFSAIKIAILLIIGFILHVFIVL